MARKAKQTAAPKPKRTDDIKWPFGPKNYVIFAIALVVIIVGYISLGQGSITLAPILLVLGYCILVPLAIWVKGKPEEQSAQPASESEQAAS